MKGAQLATVVWIGNLLVLCMGGFLGFKYYTGIESDRDATYKRVQTPRTKLTRVSWQEQNQNANAGGIHSLSLSLSPRRLPAPPTKPVVEGPKPVEKEPSDEELKAELEKWINEEFTLIRLWGTATATVKSKKLGDAVNLQFFPGMKFKQEYSGKFLDAKVKQLAQHDLTVVSLHIVPGDPLADHVIMNGPSVRPKYAKKYFDVTLKMTPKVETGRDPTKLGKPSPSTTTKVELPDKTPPPIEDTQVDPRPRESKWNEETGEWFLGTDDFARPEVYNEMVQYARVVQDAQGKPIGIQIADNVPENSLIVRRGGRRGDIIKSINGQPVRSVGEARRIGKEEYDKGITSFEVIFERDGVPQSRKFTVPPKKK